MSWLQRMLSWFARFTFDFPKTPVSNPLRGGDSTLSLLQRISFRFIKFTKAFPEAPESNPLLGGVPPADAFDRPQGENE